MILRGTANEEENNTAPSFFVHETSDIEGVLRELNGRRLSNDSTDELSVLEKIPDTLDRVLESCNTKLG